MKRYSVHNEFLGQTFYKVFKFDALSCARMLNNNRPPESGTYVVRKIKTGEIIPSR